MSRLLIHRPTSYLSSNSGGPDGYLWQLRRGLEKLGEKRVDFIEDGPPAPAGAPVVAKKPSRFPEFSRRRHLVETELFALTGVPPRWNPLRYRNRPETEITRAALDSHAWVHAHFTQDADKLLQRADRKKLILSSHSPEAPALEMRALLSAKGLSSRYEKLLLETLLARDLDAFRRADAWIFPSPGAMEPYRETLPGFTELIGTKPVAFVPTGVSPPARPVPEAIAKRRIAPAGEIQVCFVGRHEPVKGYDIFKEAGMALLAADPKVHIVCAGVGSLAAPEHPRWHELGRINDVQALLCASDLFVLPNRRTYYDLILIEALAAGVPVVATATGGNRDVAACTEAVRLCAPDSTSMLEVMRAECAAPAARREALRELARSHYLEHHTDGSFARGYVRALTELSVLPA